MKLIICVDENNGMLFNNRRQSRDRVLIKHILDKIQGNKLWINSFSKDIFAGNDGENIIEDDQFIEKATKEDYCFIENITPSTVIEMADEVILYNWNRNYPTDKYFDVSLEKWNLVSEIEFQGFSHEKITERIYSRREF